MHLPINPLVFAGGLVLPLPDGRALWCLAPLPDDASDPALVHFNRYLAALRGLGHTVVVGDQSTLVAALAEELTP